MYRRVKRVLDVTVALPLYVLWWLTFNWPIRIVIRAGSYGHSLLTQERVGLNGASFIILKLRTMHSDAHEIGKANGIRPGEKHKDDPRVTPFGKILRKASIDEVPQLYNIIMGKMSFVGPRPPQRSEVEEWEREYGAALTRKRFEALPGLTGWAQVNGRDSLTPKERLEHDKYYVEHQSFLLDLEILVRTIPTLLNWKSAN